MRTGADAGGTPKLIHAQVALARLQNRSLRFFIDDKCAVFIANSDHLNIVIRATVGAGRATDAGDIINHHLSFD